MTPPGDTSFERLTEPPARSPTLVEGLPGLGMVASIAVDQVTDQLGLDHHGNLHLEDLPPTASFADGLVRDPIRVYAGADPDVITLQSDVPIPPESFDSLSSCVLDDLAAEFDRAIFVAGAPARSEDQRGEIVGVATTPAMRDDVADAGIDVAESSGAVGGVTGALAKRCYDADVPAAVLVVHANPYVPDPGAARTLVEEALEPLVEFDIDTAELREQAEQIQQQKQRIAKQLQQLQQGESGQGGSPRPMYQ
ncbi:MAG: proteasome assembly chaperone family protein [Haloferacaceae archaeon]